MTPTKQDIAALHQRLLAADQTYANNRNPHTHANLLTIQRAYYTAYRHYDPHPLHRAKRLRARVQANRRMERDNPAWQELTAHQWQRAWQTHARIRFYLEENLPTSATTPPFTSPRIPPTRTYTKHDPNAIIPHREKHPITGRYVTVMRTQAEVDLMRKQRILDRELEKEKGAH